MAECAKTDSVGRLRDAPGRHANPTPMGTANSVSSTISQLQHLVFGTDTDDTPSNDAEYTYGTVYASRKLQYPDSDSSDERPC